MRQHKHEAECLGLMLQFMKKTLTVKDLKGSASAVSYTASLCGGIRAAYSRKAAKDKSTSEVRIFPLYLESFH